MLFRSRLCRLVLLALLAISVFSLAGPPSASAHCPCWEECAFFTTFWVFCMPATQGMVGYCHCKERPCYVSGEFCSIIWVTP